jgi:hypothetical protein
MAPGARGSTSSGRAAAGGFCRMPRTSAEAAWPASTSAMSSRANQAWPTQAVGQPVDCASRSSQRV